MSKSVITLKLNGEYESIKDLYQAMLSHTFTAGVPELFDAESRFPFIVFPMLDRSNQVQIVRNAFTKKYSVTRAVYAAGHVAENMYLDERTHGLATMSGAFGDTKKECLRLVQVTADEMMAAGL